MAEDALFSLPELSSLAQAFRSKRYPGPEELLAAFDAFLAARSADLRWIVNDGSWLLLAEDLPWAQASWSAIAAFSARLRAMADAWNPVVLYVDTPVERAMARARARDGAEAFDRWLEAMRRLPALADVADAPVTELAAAWCARVRALLDAGGWRVIDLDGSLPVEGLVEVAVERLTGGGRGSTVGT